MQCIFLEARKQVVVHVHCLGGLSGVMERPLRHLGGTAGSIRQVSRQVAKVRIQDLDPKDVGLEGKEQREGRPWALWKQGLWTGYQRVPQTQEVSDLVTRTAWPSLENILFKSSSSGSSYIMTSSTIHLCKVC